MTNKPQFDAAGFFESEGLTFKGLDKEGNALVETETGEKGSYNIKELLKSEGLNPDAAITYNSFDQPLNESPVGFYDRFKMSFGNTKGSVNYLKQNFEDANVTPVGDLVVKDKGVWKRVDLDGFGDDSGWKISEVMADLVADTAGDIALGAAATGATIATVGTGGAASIPIAAAAGALGGGLGSIGTKQVLGRLMGTYEASPEEAIKDVAFDAVLGAAGEGIALGAQKYVVPSVVNAFKKFGGAAEGTQRVVAEALGKLDGNGPEPYRVFMANSDEVGKLIQEFSEEGVKRAGFQGADQIASGSIVSSSTAAKQAAEESVLGEAQKLVKGAQSAMSDFYGRELDTLIKTNLKEPGKLAASIVENSVHIQNNIDEVLSPFLSSTGGQSGKAGLATANSVQKLFGSEASPVSAKLAGQIARKVNDIRTMASGLSNLKSLDGEKLKGVIKVSDEILDIVSSLPVQVQQQFKSLGLENIDTAINQALGKEFSAGISGLKGQYRQMKSLMNGIVGPTYKPLDWTTASQNFVKAYRDISINANPVASKIVSDFASIVGPKQTGEKLGIYHLQQMAKKNSAATIMGYSATTPSTVSGLTERIALATGRRVALPVATAVSKAQRKASLRSFLASDRYKFLTQNADMIKTGGQELLNNPEALGGFLATYLSAAQYDDSMDR